MAISLPTDTQTHTPWLSHTLLAWPFPFTTLFSNSSMPWADKLYQLTHLSLHAITVPTKMQVHIGMCLSLLSWKGRRMLPQCVRMLVCKPYMILGGLTRQQYTHGFSHHTHSFNTRKQNPNFSGNTQASKHTPVGCTRSKTTPWTFILYTSLWFAIIFHSLLGF